MRYDDIREKSTDLHGGFPELGKSVAEDTITASNTSAPSLQSWQAELKFEERCIGSM